MSVVDFDRILVIKDGVDAEFGSPKALLDIEGGLFREMVSDIDEKDELEKSIVKK